MICSKAKKWIQNSLNNHFLSEIKIRKIKTNYFGTFFVDTEFGEIKAKFMLLPSPKLPWRLTFSTSNLNSSQILLRLGDKAREFSNLAGEIDINGAVFGFLRADPFLSDWFVQVEGKKLSWLNKPKGNNIPFSGVFRIVPASIKIESLVIGKDIQLKGIVNSPWKNPSLKLVAGANNISIAQLSKWFPQMPLEKMGGNFSAVANIVGSLHRPVVKGNISANVSYAKIKIPTLEGIFSLNKNKFFLEADGADGRITIQGSHLENAELSNWRIKTSGVSLRSIALKNQWKTVNGIMDLDLTVGLDESRSPKANGDIVLKKFQWGRMKATQEVRGKLTLNEKVIHLDSQALDLKVNFQKSLAKVDVFRLTFDKNSTLAITGVIDLDEETLKLSIKGTDIPPDAWPPLVERYPHITGSMNIEGNMTGPWKNFKFENAIAFENLKLMPWGKTWEGKANLNATSDEISLSDIQIKGGYSGAVVWNPHKDKGEFKIDVRLQEAMPALIFEVLRSSLPAKGIIDGQLILDIRNSLPMGDCSFNWTNGSLGSFNFDQAKATLVFENHSINLTSFLIEQGPRAIRGTAKGTKNDNKWVYTGNIQFQQWGNADFSIDGETITSGYFLLPKFSFFSKLESPILWANNFSFENIKTDVSFNGQEWLINGRSNDNIWFNLNYQNPTKQFQGIVKGRNINAEDLLSKLMIHKEDIPKGQFNFELQMKKDDDPLRAEIITDSKNLIWRNEKMSGHGQFRLTGTTVSIQNSEILLQSGGVVKLTGNIFRNQEPSLELKGIGSGLNLQSLFHILNWPITWNGSTDVTVELSGPLSTRKTQLTFKGRHDGFGPFPLGGTMTGTVTEKNRQWDLTGIRVESGNGYLSLLPGSKIFLDSNGAGTMHILADSRNLKAGFLTFFGGAEVTGAWRPPSKMEGKKVRAPVELDLFAKSLWVNQLVLDGNFAHLTLKPGEVTFSPILGSGQQMSGTIHHKNFPTLLVEKFQLIDKGVEKYFIDGLVGPTKWDYNLRIKDVDSSLVRGLFDTILPISGLMEANLKGEGSISSPVITGSLSLREGQLYSLPIDWARCLIDYRKGILEAKQIEAFRKRGFLLTGRVRFQTNGEENREQPEIDLLIENGDLTFLRDVWPTVSKSKGNFNARFQMLTKSWGRSISGFLKAEKISLISPYTPHLEKGEIRVRLDKNRFHIEDVHAKLGKGLLSLAGYVDFKNGLADFYNLSLRTPTENGIEIRVPELSISPGPFLGKFGILKRRLAGSSRGEPLINLILKGSSSSPLLAGTIHLENTVFTYPPSIPLRSTSNRSPFNQWLKEFWDKLRMDISLVAGARTWFQNELVDANIKGSIHFTGLPSDLDINGRIETEQGSIVYSGSEFKIKDATLELVTSSPTLNSLDQKQTLVYLKANAEKQVFYTDGLANNNQDIIVMSLDRSLIGEIQPRFTSRYNPNLSPQRALQLALGLPLSDSIDDNNLLPDQRGTRQVDQKADTDKVLRLGVVQLLESNLASPLARALARNTGLVDVIRISYQENDPLADNSQPLEGTTQVDINQSEFLKYAKGTKVKFGRGLSSRLFADYSVRVDEYQNQVDFRHEVELSYQLKQNLYLRGISELDNQQQLGRAPDRRALLENQWRFGLPKSKKKVGSPESEKPIPH
ncbi:MAG: hypothetical protein KCHDKBKB_00558 [Elusimicrobia bacterium]|nr:hypothetical protein [Elusimicrobiota bacterium]